MDYFPKHRLVTSEAWPLPDRPPVRRDRYRVHLLAMGDVGSTLAMGLRLMGGDVISTLGICDVREGVPQRWEFELSQIAGPGEDRLPPVEIVEPDRVLDCDVFLFCASRFVPDTAVKSGDVRMAQYELNRELAASYGRLAREKNFRGMFCVVSDPVDPLCRAAWLASNLSGETESPDLLGLLPEQIQGFGLGVMNARAAYFAKRDPRFAAFLTEGRSFGPHGQGLVIANSIARYDDALSRELTRLTLEANLRIRELGFKPYLAPAVSSGAMQLLLALRGAWHCGSIPLGGIWFGCRNRFTAQGLEWETLELPDALFSRILETEQSLLHLSQ